ncbi:putative tRNA threonylcarbamoyladenosine biosynthesis protein YwlC [Propionispora sp. 2/2-37]|uniref:L-threonylcarbamoyladenylate synthase n=1 Tax=Propionispora sp. 2/2-37 TaxID=1677858 RepID=UPI0006BB97AE|nr:L-threonylcarbamoyladenylate synthase [Propionispora sp. 2/2-37]CUH95478.1 putative tRNA threonylcarbamoyladenosine biosynthesis protein YwlC [Propionispora sp. 2/2-37]
MNTEHIIVNRKHPDKHCLRRAAQYLRQGGLVAFPTETVYGLGANGLDREAVANIFKAKGRPGDNPLILHIAERDEVGKLAAAISANAALLMDTYWPGPLTVILPRQPVVPDMVTGGLDTVAIRLPDSVVARALIRLAGVPVAAPSANISGRPSPTNAGDVLADMNGKIAAVVDAGDCNIGVESTIVDCTTPVPTLLRPGGITLEMLFETLGEVEVDPALVKEDEIPKAPGMKYTHYAPLAPMTLVEGATQTPQILLREINRALTCNKRVGAVVSEETAAILPDNVILAVWGKREDTAAAAAALYTVLRYFDDKPVDMIYAEGITEKGLGLAVMNRLRKASGYRSIKN